MSLKGTWASNSNVVFELFKDHRTNSHDGLNFGRLRKCWSRPVEIDEFERPKHRSDSSPTSASEPAQGLPASPKTERRIRKDMDGSVAFDRLRLTIYHYLGAYFLVMATWSPGGYPTAYENQS
ncbi:hypothetical protein ARMGADRAFT_692697 [Armillaria gallica]|uniref:Uncharacterized protein n=1 Tax=Armillaria gallica TaxID=47427 RepID=A0A2H3DM82_ARMGA|nr:hypothetical protein ARMGADRAFT_692697 [Armillaria gallica]